MSRAGRSRDHHQRGYDQVYAIRTSWWPYAATPAGAVAMLAGTEVAHVWTADTVGWTASGLTLAGVGLTWLTHRASRPRGQVRQVVSTALCGGGCLWALGATLAGPITSPWLGLWALGAVTGSVGVGIMRVMRAGGEGEQIAHSLGAGAGGSLAEHVRALREAHRIERAQLSGAKATQGITLAPGTTISELQGERGAIASTLDVPLSAVRVIPDPDSVRRGTIEVVPVDQLTSTPWPGLSAPGESIAMPISIGRREDGDELLLYLPGDHSAGRNASHLMIVGMSGAGKTGLILTIAATVIVRSDAELWIADPRKGAQLPAWLTAGAARVATSEAETDAMLEDISASVSTRAAWLGERGYSQWTRAAGAAGLAYRVVIVDEAAAVSAGNPLITELTETCRSVGISLIFGLQRATHDRFPTSARSNMGSTICLGVADETDATMALSDETLAQGAMPWAWKTTRPGYLYAQLPHIPADQWGMPCRSWTVGEDVRAAALAPWLPGAATGSALEETMRLPGVEAEAETAPVDQLAALRDQVSGIDIAQPLAIPERPRMVIPVPVEMAPEEARDCFRRYLRDLAASGRVQEVAPGGLADVMQETGRGQSWINTQFRQATEEGLLIRTGHGVYRLAALALA